jgi:glycosyltransferase involved in cell wall biosynthesis
MNKLIVVLGMHRSGTSAVTRSLTVMGIDLGDKMMPPMEGNNPKGFWEDIDINALNIEMMHALSSDWHYLTLIDAVDVETLRSKGFFLRAVDLIRKKIDHAPSFGFKDPRVAKLLPFWKEVINYCQFDVSYILAIRHPRSVVKSLAKRDSIEESKGYFLWLGHVIASLAGSSGKNRVLVDYDVLMQSPDHELERIAKNLGLEINDAELQSYKKEFLDHSLRHTIYQPNDLMLDDACPPLVYEIYTKLLEIATDQSQIDTPDFQERIEQWAAEFVRLKSALQLADRLYRQREVAVQSLAECDNQIANLKQAVTERDGQIANLKQALAEREGQIANLKQALAERDGQIANLKQALAEREGQIANLNQAVTEREGQIANLNQAVTEREGQIANLNQAVAEREGQIANLRFESDRIVIGKDSEIHKIREQLNQIFHSRSWRATAPLRKVVVTMRQGVPSPRRMLFLGSVVRQIRDSSLFDAEYYLASNPDVQNAGVDPAKHYLLHGWREHRDPSTAFSTSQYLFDNRDVARAQINPLVHYLRHGCLEGRPIKLQTSELQVTLSPVSVPSISVPQRDQVVVNDQPVANGHENTSNAAIDAEVEAIRKSGLFDESFYRSMYPNALPPSSDAIRHYCEFGWREGKNPTDDFDTRGYLNANNDIKNGRINPFWHYIIAGAKEARKPLPESDDRFEDDIYLGKLTSDIKLVAYYATPDWGSVQRARKAVIGAGQGLMPHEDIGLYRAYDYETLSNQVLMAKRHGVIAWCFTLDAANGPVAGEPLSAFLSNRDIDIQFCLDINLRSGKIGGGAADCLEAALSDERCLRVDGRPVLVLTLPDDESDCVEVLRAFDTLFIHRKASPPYRIARRNRRVIQAPNVASPLKWEAFLDLPVDSVLAETGGFQPLSKNGVDTVPYSVVVSRGIARIGMNATPSVVPCYWAVTLGHDDSPVNSSRPLRYTRFHLKEYRRWLDAAIADTRGKHSHEKRLLFINAWNDWNRGAVLEPDKLSGYSKLNETSRALLGLPAGLALPKVSVIVPNYNHAPFLRRRLESIYRQTYKNIEVLLLDDCSTDQSREVLLEYVNRYSENTTVLFNEKNSGGVFRQWAKGIKAASGNLIWIAESDDYCDENFLEKLVRCFDDEAVMLAYSRTEFVRADESVMPNKFWGHVYHLTCREKWKHSYVNTAHKEVSEALGIINTIPNASGVLARRPVDMPLLENEAWLSLRVVGDWVFYLHLMRGGKMAYTAETTNYFRRHENSVIAKTCDIKAFCKELSVAAQTVHALYDVHATVLDQFMKRSKELYDHLGGESNEEFTSYFDEEQIRQARCLRTPNIVVSAMGFSPGGAEIIAIRMANEFKRQGHSVLLLNLGIYPREDGVRRMLRGDVPVVETSDPDTTENIFNEFGIEVLNSHQWEVQKYPFRKASVFRKLKAHVASLHGMIENIGAFGVTGEQLKVADKNVTTWVYTADKNLGLFIEYGLYKDNSLRFVKLPNGMEPPTIKAVSRSEIGMPDDAFVLCCVSRAVPEKGWAETIDAVGRARQLSGHDIRLILVGNGSVYDEYCRTGVPEFVYLAGFSDNSVGYYASADMGIMLTKFGSESFPLTIIDCLFAGKPYIASDVGDIRNMLTISDDVAGEVIELEDWEVPVERVAQVIEAFVTDKKKYTSALSLVPDVANRYHIDIVASQYIRLFEDSHDEKRLLSKGNRN